MKLLVKKWIDKADKFIKKNKLNVLKGVLLFWLITLAIHFSYRFWASKDYWPVGSFMHLAHHNMEDMVFTQSSWFDSHILGIPLTKGENRVIHFEGGGFIGISEGCSGLKQILQFMLLFLIFPGPWKRKLWFIPLGVLIVHLTNLFRIIGLSIVTITIPRYWDFLHDYMFRPFFYVVIFLLWIWWVEKLS